MNARELVNELLKFPGDTKVLVVNMGEVLSVTFNGFRDNPHNVTIIPERFSK